METYKKCKDPLTRTLRINSLRNEMPTLIIPNQYPNLGNCLTEQAFPALWF